MRLAPWLPFLASKGALPPCARGDFDHCEHDAAKCAGHRRRALDVDWQTCPVREVLASEHLPLIRGLDQDAELAPLSLWPQRYAAWVPRFWRAYRTERSAALAAMTKG